MDNHTQTRWCCPTEGWAGLLKEKKEMESYVNSDAYFQGTLIEMRSDINESKVISSEGSGIVRSGSPLQSTRNRKRKDTFGEVHCQTIVDKILT